MTERAKEVGSGVAKGLVTVVTAPIKLVQAGIRAVSGDPSKKWQGSAEAKLMWQSKSEFATCIKCKHRVTREGYDARDENEKPFLEHTPEAKVCLTHPGRCQVVEDGTESAAYSWTCCKAKRKDSPGCQKGMHELKEVPDGFENVVFYDASAFSLYALERATKIRAKGQSVAIVNIITDYMTGERKREAEREHTRLLHERSSQLTQVMDDLDRREVPDIEAFVFLTTRPYTAAVKIAQDLHCRAVLVGSRGSSGVLQGSFAKYVAEQSSCDVIIIRHQMPGKRKSSGLRDDHRIAIPSTVELADTF
eukprot:gb/GEZN01003695.1/.p1 GENE.gb/GEZN01003695.1/~~gb/GEZN01003695.1/.p1  ORF type:complete len:306 (+),score=44.71 gb/GEZN01003695.1/:281-1198(+)